MSENERLVIVGALTRAQLEQATFFSLILGKLSKMGQGDFFRDRSQVNAENKVRQQLDD